MEIAPCKECDANDWDKIPGHVLMYECNACGYPEAFTQEEIESLTKTN